MADYWQLADFTLTDASLPYNQLPRASCSLGPPLSRWFTAGVDAEVVSFAHEVCEGRQPRRRQALRQHAPVWRELVREADTGMALHGLPAR